MDNLIAKYKALDLERGISATKSMYTGKIGKIPYISDFITISQEMEILRKQIGQTHGEIMGYKWE
jgi:hypothetical protein